MIKKKKLFVTIALGLLIIFTTCSFALANPLPVVQYEQSYSCWCASASHICGYFDDFSDEVDYLVCEYQIFDYYGESVPGRMSWVEGGVQYITGINGSVQLDPLTWAAVKYQIDNDCPMVAGLADYNNSEHTITIRGYKTENLINYCYYSDPKDGVYHLRPYNYIYSTFDWVETAFWA